MSVISDALKVDERPNRAKSGGEPSSIDGFFPYVDSAPPPSNSKRWPLVATTGTVLAIAAVSLYAVTALREPTGPVYSVEEVL